MEDIPYEIYFTVLNYCNTRDIVKMCSCNVQLRKLTIKYIKLNINKSNYIIDYKCIYDILTLNKNRNSLMKYKCAFNNTLDNDILQVLDNCDINKAINEYTNKFQVEYSKFFTKKPLNDKDNKDNKVKTKFDNIYERERYNSYGDIKAKIKYLNYLQNKLSDEECELKKKLDICELAYKLCDNRILIYITDKCKFKYDWKNCNIERYNLKMYGFMHTHELIDNDEIIINDKNISIPTIEEFSRICSRVLNLDDTYLYTKSACHISKSIRYPTDICYNEQDMLYDSEGIIHINGYKNLYIYKITTEKYLYRYKDIYDTFLYKDIPNKIINPQPITINTSDSENSDYEDSDYEDSDS